MEESTLRKMSDLRKQGMTYQGIADLFNSENMPTSTGKGKWDKRTIQRVMTVTLQQIYEVRNGTERSIDNARSRFR